MKLIFHPFELPLKHTFTTSHGSRDSIKTLVVELQEGKYSGYGEAAAISYYGITVEKMKEALEQIQPLAERNGHLSPEAFWELTHPYLGENPFAQSALDIAMHDLYGKKKDMPLFRLWGNDVKHLPLTSYTIGIDTAAKMVQKMKDFPWPLYKIKLGTRDDVSLIRELRKHTTSLFRVDANGGWSADETIANSAFLKELGVEFIEQPLPREDWDGMKKVYLRSALPLIADESCQQEGDEKKCKGHFHGINIKLAKCGGITPARRMITGAKMLGLKVMAGCMTESSVGISAIAQLLPELDYVDMDGALLLKKDIAEGVKIFDNKIHFPAENGTGVRLIRSDD